MHVPSLRHGLAALFLSALVIAPTYAQQQVVIGTPQGQNYFPFGYLAPTIYQPNPPNVYAAGGEYQEIYPSQAFQNTGSGSFYIDSIGFASSYDTSATVALYNVTLNLSSTQAAMNDPSNTFQQNRGFDFAQVYSGAQSAFPQGNNTFDLIFSITPFRYNPSNGNLLLDVVVNNPTLSDGNLTFATTGSDQSARIFQSFGLGPSVADGAGLYTEFGVSPVPESSTALGFGLLLCLGGLILAVQRRRASR